MDDSGVVVVVEKTRTNLAGIVLAAVVVVERMRSQLAWVYVVAAVVERMTKHGA